MNKIKIILLSSILLLLSGSLISQEKEIRINENIKLIKLNESFYVHVTLFDLPEIGTFASNGLIFVKNGKAILIDTPNDDAQTQQLCEYLNEKMDIKIEKVIVGHSHSDCMGGLNYLKSQKVESIANVMTREICKKQNLPLPSKTFAKKLEFDFYGEQVVCQYFGAGHTIDNIVVHFPGDKVLFGGCLIRTANVSGLGNIAEADTQHWDATVQKIEDTYPKLDYIIPGHGAIGDHSLLGHTINLVKEYKKMIKSFIDDKEFKNIDFSETKIEKAEYENCHFLNCNFANIDLSDISFSECRFDNCDLSMSTLTKTAFRNADFKNSKLLGLRFENCNPFLFAVKFENCQLNFSSFFKMNLKQSVFTNCMLLEVDFVGANLQGSIFQDSDLSEAQFENTNLEKVDFRSAINYSIDPEINKIKKAKFSRAGIQGLLHQFDIEIE